MINLIGTLFYHGSFPFALKFIKYKNYCFSFPFIFLIITHNFIYCNLSETLLDLYYEPNEIKIIFFHLERIFLKSVK